MDTNFSGFKVKQMVKPVWKWIVGLVDTNKDHIKLWYGNPPAADRKGSVRQSGSPVALLARGPGKTFTVQWLLKAHPSNQRALHILKAVRRDLDFYLLEVGGPDPWAYAQYHCFTGANIYSKVHWAWHPKGSQGSVKPHSSFVVREGSRKFIFKPNRGTAV